MNTLLLPYTTVDGMPTFADSFVRNLFNRMVEDDTAKSVFFDGSVKDPDEFLNIMKFGNNALWIVSVDEEISGVVWLNNFEQKRASFHFCFFSNVWGKDTVSIGKKCVLTLLELKSNGEYDFDLLTGLVPLRNEKAIKWCQEMNFEIIGRLPCSVWNAEEQKSEDGIIFYVERGKYNG
jgi:hypothetical protein